MKASLYFVLGAVFVLGSPRATAEPKAQAKAQGQACKAVVLEIFREHPELSQHLPNVERWARRSQSHVPIAVSQEKEFAIHLLRQALSSSDPSPLERFLALEPSLSRAPFEIIRALLLELKFSRGRALQQNQLPPGLSERLDVFERLREKIKISGSHLNEMEFRILVELSLEALIRFLNEDPLSIVDQLVLLDQIIWMFELIGNSTHLASSRSDLIDQSLYELQLHLAENKLLDHPHFQHRFLILKLQRAKMLDINRKLVGSELQDALAHVFANDISSEFRVAAIHESLRVLESRPILYSLYFKYQSDKARKFASELEDSRADPKLVTSLGLLADGLDRAFAESLIAMDLLVDGTGPLELPRDKIFRDGDINQLLFSMSVLMTDSSYTEQMIALFQQLLEEDEQVFSYSRDWDDLLEPHRDLVEEFDSSEGAESLREAQRLLKSIYPIFAKFALHKELKQSLEAVHPSTRRAIESLRDLELEDLSFSQSKYFLSSAEATALYESILAYDLNTRFDDSETVEIESISPQRIVLAEGSRYQHDWFLASLQLDALKANESLGSDFELNRRRYASLVLFVIERSIAQSPSRFEREKAAELLRLYQLKRQGSIADTD